MGTYSGNYIVTNNATYGPGTGTTILNGNLNVNSNATLQNLTVNGTIFVNPGDDGHVELNNVNATNIVILSGGTSSVILNKVVAENLTVKNDNSIRVETKGATAITNTSIQSGAILEATAGSFGAIDLAPNSSAPITLKGNFGDSAISVTKSNTVLNVEESAVVGTLTVSASGTTVNNAGTINEVDANVATEITGTPPVKVTEGSDIDISTTVGNETELKAALANKNVKKIIFNKDIETSSQILITQANQSIDGAGFVLKAKAGMTYLDPNKSVLTILSASGVSISNLKVDASAINSANKWDGIYALQVYNSTGVKLTNVSLQNGDGGLLVNGSTVVATDIETRGNEFGGVEVSKGIAVGLPNSSLTINGNSVHEDAAGKPAVWVYPEQGSLVSDSYVVTAKAQGNGKNQTYYNLKSAISVYDFVIGEYETVKAGNQVDVPVTLKATTVNKLGYGSVIAEVSTTKKPADSTVTFNAIDSIGNDILQTDNGTWGPNTGFAVANNYDAVTPFAVTFSKVGEYTIIVKLKDLVSGEYLAEKTVNVTVTE